MKHKCRDCQHWRVPQYGELGPCPKQSFKVVGEFETNCEFFLEKEDVKPLAAEEET